MTMRKPAVRIVILFVSFMGLAGNRAYPQSARPLDYYDYYTMSMGDAKIAVLNPNPRENALFLHNPAGMSYIPKKRKRQLIRLPFQLMMRTVNPKRKDVFEWGERLIQTWINEARFLIAVATTDDWNYIKNMSKDELYNNLLEPNEQMKNNILYQLYDEEIGYLMRGYWDLYSGNKTLPEIYAENPEFEEHLEDAQEGTDHVKSNFSNTEIVARMDTRSTLGWLGKKIDNLFNINNIFESALSWDFGATGFLHPRSESLLQASEGPYTPFWLIDLEVDTGYSLGVSKKIDFDMGSSGTMPLSLGFRYNKLYRFALDSYMSPSTILSALFGSGVLSGGSNPTELFYALGGEVIDKMVMGTADSFEMGLLFEPPGIPLMFGAVARNVGGTNIYQADIVGNRIVASDTVVGGINQSFDVGVSYKTVTDIGNRSLLVALDLRDMGGLEESIFLKLHFGGEYELVKDSVFIRAGVNQGYITYGISAVANLVICKLYFEASKYEAEKFGSRLPGVHTVDPYYTYGLSLRIKTPLPLKLKANQDEEDMYF